VVVPDGNGQARVHWGMPRSVLAALLLSPNRVVSAERLVDVVWGDEPPAFAGAALQNHVMRTRRALGDEAWRLRTIAPGYAVEVTGEELDLTVFERLSRKGRRALDAGEWEAASGALREALTLWRGDPLEDVDSEVLREREVPRLEEWRLETVEARVEADLRLGRHEELVGELSGLVAAYPLRERLHGQLMMAYCGEGRSAEALKAFARAREVLAEALGADPGPYLRELHQRVLAQDAGLAPRVRPGTPQAPTVSAQAAAARRGGRLRRGGAVRPAQLPAAVADFTGRSAEVAWLTGVLNSAGGQPGVVPVAMVTGLCGTGKTSLAVHLAHRVSRAFPDGQLFTQLSGPDGCPVPVKDVLGGFLRALGVGWKRVPDGEAERAATYRSLLAGSRVLVVLDDARDEQQVRPLLPGTAGCAVIVTSSGQPVGAPEACTVRLGPLPGEESAALLAGIIGADRAEAEAQAVAEIARLCDRLPLALRIAGDRLVARPHWKVADLAARLAEPAIRLDELAAGGLSVRAALDATCTALPGGPDGALGQAFQRLGRLDSHDIITPASAAAVLGTCIRAAESSLDALVDRNLVHVGPAPGQYKIPPLLAIYAREKAGAQQPQARAYSNGCSGTAPAASGPARRP